MNSTKQPQKERAARFVAGLRSLQDDRASLAALRRGLSPATVMDAWPVIARLGGDIGQVGESVFVTIAALYAIHNAEETSDRNFGATCRMIALADSHEGKLTENYERRFRRLISSSDLSDLSYQTRTWIRLAASKGVGINYESLFVDFWNWRWYADDIRLRWARSFWRAEAASSDLKPDETATSEQTEKS